jgi:hypothetical protein
MELFQMSPQIDRNKTPEDQKQRISSARQNLLLQKGVQVPRHIKHKEQAIGSHFYS